MLLKKLLPFFVLFLFSMSSHATLFTANPYKSFADSPFNGVSGIMLEDFEGISAGNMYMPPAGISVSNNMIVNPINSPIVDSVDADDGVIDGSGLQGSTLFSSPGIVGVEFSFDNSFATYAGIVWTDGEGLVSFEAFDENGVSLGGYFDQNIADNSVVGTTDEDTFFGVMNAGGISKIRVWNTNGGIEVDHFQYSGTIVPIPAALWMFGSAVLGLVGCSKRKQ